MKLFRPVATNRINQWFGENLNSLYAKLKMLGHNGVDFHCYTGEPFYWNCDLEGKIHKMYYDEYGGVSLEIITQEGDKIFKHTVYHSKDYRTGLKKDDIVRTGDLILYCDNTGKGTTGTHSHALEIKPMGKDQYGNYYKLYPNNGYLGAIDPTPYFTNIFVLDLLADLNFQTDINYLEESGEVWKLQRALQKLGFFNREPTGFFGNITRLALLNFQIKNIPLTWYERWILAGRKCGLKTRTKLNEMLK